MTPLRVVAIAVGVVLTVNVAARIINYAWDELVLNIGARLTQQSQAIYNYLPQGR